MDDRSGVGPLAPASGRNAARDPALDGVRGLAILTVVIHNASWIEDKATALPLKLFMAVTASGWIGVSLFFVLSGVLITGILLDTRDDSHYFSSFYLRRTLRIFPLYYAFLALVFWAGPHVVHDAAWTASVHAKQGWYWTYLSNWIEPIDGLPHFWSLAVEEQFYLAWPLLVWLLGGRKLLWVCVAMIVTGPLIRLGLQAASDPTLADYEFTMSRWDALAVGAVVAVLLRQVRGRAWLLHYGAAIGTSALGALAMFIVLNHGFHSGEPMVDIVGQSLVAIGFGAFIVITIAPRGSTQSRVRQALSAPWLRFFGKYSYAIYIFHVTLHRVARIYLSSVVNRGGTTERLARLVAYDLAILAASVVLALVSWHLLEKHTIRLKDRIALSGRSASTLRVPLPGQTSQSFAADS